MAEPVMMIRVLIDLFSIMTLFLSSRHELMNDHEFTGFLGTNPRARFFPRKQMVRVLVELALRILTYGKTNLSNRSSFR